MKALLKVKLLAMCFAATMFPKFSLAQLPLGTAPSGGGVEVSVVVTPPDPNSKPRSTTLGGDDYRVSTITQARNFVSCAPRYGCSFLMDDGEDSVIREMIKDATNATGSYKESLEKEILAFKKGGPETPTFVALGHKKKEDQAQTQRERETLRLELQGGSEAKEVREVQNQLIASHPGVVTREPALVFTNTSIASLTDLGKRLSFGLEKLVFGVNSVPDLIIPSASAGEVVRFGVGATPILGDAMDVAEFITGQSASPPYQALSDNERVFAGMGILFGNRAVWNEVAKGTESAAAVLKRLTGVDPPGPMAVELDKVGHAAASGIDVRYYSPLERGPLSDVMAAPGVTVANTFRAATYVEHVTTEPMTLYRVFSDDGRMFKSYWSAIEPSGGIQAMADLALDPKWHTGPLKWVKIEVPAGTRLYQGVAAPIKTQGGGVLLGGGHQVYVPEVDPNWFVSRGDFK